MKSRITRSVLAAELLKVRKRWLPYVLLLPVIAILGMQVFAGYFAGWRHDHDTEALRWSVLPSALPSMLDLIQYLGSIVFAIVAASTVATEYNWGTARQTIVRGITRDQYLATKLLGLLALAGMGFLFVLAMGLVFSGSVSVLEDRRPAGPSAGEAVLMVLRAAYGILPYVLLAFSLAVVGRSTTLGVGGTLVFIIGESIVIGILTGIGGGAADARGFFLGHNVAALLAANRLYPTDAISLAPRPPLEASELPGAAVGALVIALYCALFLAVAFWVFRRRDLTAEAGGS